MWVRSQDKETLIDGSLFQVEENPGKGKKEWGLWAGKETCSDVQIGSFSSRGNAIRALGETEGHIGDPMLTVYQVQADSDYAKV